MEKVHALMASRVGVELMFTFDAAGDAVWGVRLRPWKNSKHAGRMILAAGYSPEEALEEAYDKALQGRWEPLDWAARPWSTPATGKEGTLDI